MRPKVLIVEYCPRIENALAESSPGEFEFHFAANISACKNFFLHTIPQLVVFDNPCHRFNDNQKEACFSEIRKLKGSLPEIKFVYFYDHILLMGCLCITKDGSTDHIFEKTANPEKIIEILKSVRMSSLISPDIA